MQSDQAMTAFMSKEHLPIINFLLVKMISARVFFNGPIVILYRA